MSHQWIKETERAVKFRLDEIAGYFKDTARTTCLVRHVGNDDGSMDFIVTSDDWPQVLAMVFRRLTPEELAAVVERACAAHAQSDDCPAPPGHNWKAQQSTLSKRELDHIRAMMLRAIKAGMTP